MAISALSAPGAPADTPPTWSTQFANAGITYSVPEDGPVCLLAHDTANGPRLYIGGQFTAIGGVPYRSIAAFDGQAWSHVHGLVSEFGVESVPMMTAMPIAGVPRVVVVGQFDAPGTLDGLGYIDEQETIQGFPPTPLSPHMWFASAFAWDSPSGPELVLGSGLFMVDSPYVSRYTAAGYGLMSPGLSTIPPSHAVFDDGTGPALYIGVQGAHAEPTQSVTKWDGATLTPLTVGIGSWTAAMCIHDDGSGPALYAAGEGMKRYRAGVWEDVPGAPRFGVFAMTSFDDGGGGGPALYVAGQFTSAGGVSAMNIARLRAGVWEAVGGGLTGGTVRGLAVFDDDVAGPRPPALYAVGRFTEAGGVSSPGIARWGVVICPSDYNADGVTSSQDFFDFLGAFFAGTADFNRDGAVNSTDFFDYLQAYFAGC